MLCLSESLTLIKSYHCWSIHSLFRLNRVEFIRFWKRSNSSIKYQTGTNFGAAYQSDWLSWHVIGRRLSLDWQHKIRWNSLKYFWPNNYLFWKKKKNRLYLKKYPSLHFFLWIMRSKICSKFLLYSLFLAIFSKHFDRVLMYFLSNDLHADFCMLLF